MMKKLLWIVSISLLIFSSAAMAQEEMGGSEASASAHAKVSAPADAPEQNGDFENGNGEETGELAEGEDSPRYVLPIDVDIAALTIGKEYVVWTDDHRVPVVWRRYTGPQGDPYRNYSIGITRRGSRRVQDDSYATDGGKYKPLFPTEPVCGSMVNFIRGGRGRWQRNGFFPTNMAVIVERIPLQKQIVIKRESRLGVAVCFRDIYDAVRVRDCRNPAQAHIPFSSSWRHFVCRKERTSLLKVMCKPEFKTYVTKNIPPPPLPIPPIMMPPPAPQVIVNANAIVGGSSYMTSPITNYGLGVSYYPGFNSRISFNAYAYANANANATGGGTTPTPNCPPGGQPNLPPSPGQPGTVPPPPVGTPPNNPEHWNNPNQGGSNMDGYHPAPPGEHQVPAPNLPASR